MQSPLGITPATPRSAPSASDLLASDSRSASAPASGQAFRTALNNANERPGRAGNAERAASRSEAASSRTSESTSAEDDVVASETDADDDAALPGDAMAMLLSWLVPTTPTTPSTTPGSVAPGDRPATCSRRPQAASWTPATVIGDFRTPDAATGQPDRRHGRRPTLSRPPLRRRLRPSPPTRCRCRCRCRCRRRVSPWRA